MLARLTCDPLFRVIAALVYLNWWKLILQISNRNHQSYIHARWRIWQEKQLISNFLKGFHHGN